MIDIHVDQIMTEEPRTVRKSQTVAEAGDVMIEADIKSVIVSDVDGCPVGILTSSSLRSPLRTDSCASTRRSPRPTCSPSRSTTTSTTTATSSPDWVTRGTGRSGRPETDGRHRLPRRETQPTCRSLLLPETYAATSVVETIPISWPPSLTTGR